MALLASELTSEQVNTFSGNFEKFKPEFLTLLEAKELYEKNALSMCAFDLQKTGVTAIRQTTEAYLFLIHPEHKQMIMQKLLCSCVSEGHEDSAQLLLENDIDLGTIEDELTFLAIACAGNNQGVVNVLLGKIGGLSMPAKKKNANQKCIVQ